MMNATQELERWSTASKFSVAVAALRHKLDRRTNSSNFLATAGSTEQADLVLSSSEDIQLYLQGGAHTAPAWPALKQAFNFDMLKRRKSGSKDDAAARDSTMSHPSTTSPRSRPAGAPVIGPASAPQRKLRQAVKGSGRHLLLTCCLHPRCDGNEDSPLDSQQQLQKTSYQGSSDSCAVDCEVFLRSPQPQQMKQHLEQQQESSECQPCCAGPIIPVAEPVTSAAGMSSTQPRTACSPAQHARCTCRALTTTARSALKQAFNFDMLKQRKSGSKEDAAASDNTMSHSAPPAQGAAQQERQFQALPPHPSANCGRPSRPVAATCCSPSASGTPGVIAMKSPAGRWTHSNSCRRPATKGPATTVLLTAKSSCAACSL
jgi:hypothetical protein